MFLIQILLPLSAASCNRDEIRAAFAVTREELVTAFGGVTAYSRTPAEGVWTDPEGDLQQDRMVMVEVVTTTELTETTMVERVTVSEHYLAVEYVAVRPPERRMKPRDEAPEMVA